MNDIFQPLHDLLERKRREPLVDRLYSAAPDRVRLTMAGIGTTIFLVCAAVSTVLPWLMQTFTLVVGATVMWVGWANALVPMLLVGLEWLAEKVVPREE